MGRFSPMPGCRAARAAPGERLRIPSGDPNHPRVVTNRQRRDAMPETGRVGPRVLAGRATRVRRPASTVGGCPDPPKPPWPASAVGGCPDPQRPPARFRRRSVCGIKCSSNLPIESVGAALDELVKALGTSALHRTATNRSQAVRSSDVPNRVDHDALRFLHRAPAQLGSRELEVLSVPIAAAITDDLVKDLDSGSPHDPAVAAATGPRNPA